jgi:hypothetical protein
MSGVQGGADRRSRRHRAMKIPAFQEAHEIGRRIAKLEGVDLPPLTKEMVKVDGKSLSEQVPQSVQAIDYMKRGLDDLIEGKMRSGAMARTEARLLRQKLNGVLEKVDAAVPEYAKARAQFSGDSKLMEAHDAGREFLRTDRDELAASGRTCPKANASSIAAAPCRSSRRSSRKSPMVAT